VQRIALWNQARTVLLGDDIEVADSSLQRVWGLLGRTGLGTGGGLWIRPSSGVHTFGMRFAIDKTYRVVRLWKSLKPWRVTSVSLAVKSVVELPAGLVARVGLQLGDTLQVVRSSAELLK
jgi:uncharacterized membrane protein (UPF0127 family)